MFRLEAAALFLVMSVAMGELIGPTPLGTELYGLNSGHNSEGDDMASDWVHVVTAIQNYVLGVNQIEPFRAFYWLRSLESAALTLYFPSGLHTVVFAPGMSLRLPRTISLVFDPGAVLRLRQVKPNGEPPVPLRAADVLLTIEGHVDAGLHQIFDLFDSSGLSLGAPAQVHGQMLGPWGNEELYPQWWGAQSDPDNLAWNLPESGNPPLKMAGDRVGHVESVDSLALQLCLNASRSGQTVCFAGDFHLANIQLGREPGETSAELIEGRAPGDNLLLEGYGGALRAPALREFPPRPVAAGPVRLAGSSRVLSIEQQVVLITNRLQAMYDGHLRGSGIVAGAGGKSESYRFHAGGDTVAFGGSWPGQQGAGFIAAFASGPTYLRELNMTSASEALGALVTKFNAHLSAVSQSGVHAHQGTGPLTRMAVVPTGESRPAVLSELVYDAVDVFVAHVCDGQAHAALDRADGVSWLPNPDPASALMRRIGRTESMLTSGNWTGLTNGVPSANVHERGVGRV